MSKQTSKTVKCLIKDYFKSSSMHGFNHIINEKISRLENWIWMILVCLAIYEVAFLCKVTVERYVSNPIVISIERDSYSWKTALPAVTICPASRLNETALQKYLDSSASSNKTSLKEFLISLAHSNYTNFENVIENDDVKPEDYMEVLHELRVNPRPTIVMSGITLDNSKYLQHTITEMGICFSLNSQLAVYNSYQYWKENQWKMVNKQKTLTMHLLDGEVFTNILNISAEYNVYLNGPYEVPDIRSKPIHSPDGFFLQLYLSVLSIICSDDAKLLKVQQRKCRLYQESNLRYYPVYSHVLCRIECRAVLARELCGCVPHFYRKMDHEKTCNVKGLHCLAKNKDRLIALDGECDCLPNCENDNYIVEEMESRKWFLGSNLQYGFKSYPEIRFKRDVIFGFADLVVYIGGMTGLFLGCSVLSCAEIVYFFTIKIFWLIKKRTTG